MMRPGASGTLIWALLGMGAAAVAARATYTTDLSAFLPRSPSATQRLLVEQLRSGPAARLILVAIDGGAPHTRARLSAELARRLRADPTTAHMLLVACTAFSSTNDMAHAKSVGFDAHCAKPLTPQRLLRVLEAATTHRAQDPC